MDATASRAFEDELVSLLPKMRMWAMHLTRNASTADDLVHDVALRVLIAKNTFTPGTYFSAWVYRIMFNHFVSTMRSRREFVGIEELPDVLVSPGQHSKLELDRLVSDFNRLPVHLKDALRQIAIEQRSYEDAAKASGCAIGTLKSRVHRARAALQARSDGARHAVP